jgi:hypothetical protein
MIFKCTGIRTNVQHAYVHTVQLLLYAPGVYSSLRLGDPASIRDPAFNRDRLILLFITNSTRNV